MRLYHKSKRSRPMAHTPITQTTIRCPKSILEFFWSANLKARNRAGPDLNIKNRPLIKNLKESFFI
jgi:hypothetical protein